MTIFITDLPGEELNENELLQYPPIGWPTKVGGATLPNNRARWFEEPLPSTDSEGLPGCRGSWCENYPS